MDSDSQNDRPNIRIEIKNTAEPMDIDDFDDEKSEEEGEIRDNSFNAKKFSNQEPQNINSKSNDIFKTSLQTLNKVDEKKLQERAERFALKPDEIKTFTEKDLQILHTSLGISSDNADHIRFEAIHIRSSNNINMENIMNYFMEYVPTTIEWIDEESCNVVWDNKMSTARALFHTSQVVRGMPIRAANEHVIDSFIMEDGSDLGNGSLLNENRQIELRDDLDDVSSLISDNSVDVSTINVPIPPGYWRVGKNQINSYSVLLRLSMKTDKQCYRIEKCSNYFRNTSSKKNDKQYKGIFSRNKDIHKEDFEKNPWGVLAKNWDEDLKFREHEHYDATQDEPLPLPENPELRSRITAKRRLGKQLVEPIKKSITQESEEKSEESEQENDSKKTKMPRMRMYADEEEEKIKRKKLLQTLKKQNEKLEKSEIPNTDLRNILRTTNKKSLKNVSEEDVDLSRHLKNRSRQLVFTIAQEDDHLLKERRHILDRLDKLRPEVKHKSPAQFEERESHQRTEKYSNRETYRERKRNSVRSRDRRSRSNSDRKYGGRMYSSRHSDEEYNSHKTKSKVALVIKTQKKPSVASAIQSRNSKFDRSSSSSSEDSSSEDSESGSTENSSSTSENSRSQLSKEKRLGQIKNFGKIPLKVEIENDHYRRK